MTRKKVKLQYIANDSARKATFRKRKKGLVKKVSELSTLCGIDACAIIFSSHEPQPEVWPSHLGVQRVVARFLKMPDVEQSKKMVDQESYIRQRIAKAEEQLRRHQKENRQKEMAQVMYRCLGGEEPKNLSMVDLNDLGWLLDQNIKDIQTRISELMILKKETEAHKPHETITTVRQSLGMENQNFHELEARMGGSDQFVSTMTPMQDYQWYMDLLRPNMHLGGDETLLPYTFSTNGQGSSFFYP